MIGLGLKKYAAEIGLKTKKEIAYGVHNHYVLTLKEGIGWKSVTFAVNFTEEFSKAVFHTLLDNTDLKKKYRIKGHEITDSLICVVFFDNPGTMTKLKEFIEMFSGELVSNLVQGADYCNCCGLKADEVSSAYVDIGGTVFYMHSDCIDKVSADSRNTAEKIQHTGSIVTGTIGAVIGAFIGAIPWAIVYYFGWFVGWLGFLIGISAKKGYELLRGKETKVKGIVILIVVILAVIFSEYLAYLISWMSDISSDPELSQLDLSVFDVSKIMVSTVFEDAEFRGAIMVDIFMGWCFAGLGIFSTLREIFSTAKRINSIPKTLND